MAGVIMLLPGFLDAWAKSRKGGGNKKAASSNAQDQTNNLLNKPDYLHPQHSSKHSVNEKLEQSFKPVFTQNELERLCAALRAIPADLDYHQWVTVGMALRELRWEQGGDDVGFELWNSWSAVGVKYPGRGVLETKWETFGKGYSGVRVTVASIYELAKQHGHVPSSGAGTVSTNNINGVHSAPHALPLKLTTNTHENALILLNQKHAVINNLGNKPVVLDWVESPIKGVGKIPSFVSFKSFEDRYRNQYINVKVNKSRITKNQPSTITVDEERELGRYWLSWGKRRTYEGIGLAPDGNLPQGYYNLWNGFAIEPRRGRWDKMKWHVQHVIGANDPNAVEYAVKWAAWTVQHPGEMAGAALVLKGEEGAGKGIFATTLQSFFGPHGLHIHSSKHMIGFNAILRNCVFLFADEAFWAGDKSGESTLKGLITDPTITIEQKGVDAIPWPNRLHIVMAANAEWVVPARHDARRYGMLDVSAIKAQNQLYFNELADELDHGGREAMLYDLLHLDLDGWHPRRIPNTAALRSQKALSMDWRDQWWSDLLQRGSLPYRFNFLNDDKKQLNVASAKILLAHASEYATGSRNFNPQALGRYLGKNGKKCRIHHTMRGAMWEFPPLHQLRTQWSELMRGWEWDLEIADWGVKSDF